jgi:hypothetical protein
MSHMSSMSILNSSDLESESSASSVSSVSSSTGNTIEHIRDLCSTKEIVEVSQPVLIEHSRARSRHHDIPSFFSVITPVVGLQARYSDNKGMIELMMRRYNKVVTLQWESFEGHIGALCEYLTASQTLCNLPSYPISSPIHIKYNGVYRLTSVEVDPFLKHGNMRFYLNKHRNLDKIMVNDKIIVPAGCINWIVEE